MLSIQNVLCQVISNEIILNTPVFSITEIHTSDEQKSAKYTPDSLTYFLNFDKRIDSILYYRNNIISTSVFFQYENKKMKKKTYKNSGRTNVSEYSYNNDSIIVKRFVNGKFMSSSSKFQIENDSIKVEKEDGYKLTEFKNKDGFIYLSEVKFNDKVSRTTKQEFDKNNHPIEIIEESINLVQFKSTLSYDLDNNKNWTKMIMISSSSKNDDIEELTIIRKLKY